MAALSQGRMTPERTGSTRTVLVDANVKIFEGALVVLAAGYAKPGATATGLVAIGRAEEMADNTGGAQGALTLRVRPGIFRFDNSAAADAITAAEIGSDCYVVDDHTVAKTSATNTRSVAGKVFDVDALGVWVEFK
ncbi:hypothetical protein [Paramagnetospirillum magneticum]|uniref:Bacteriophage lambda head decoration protein D n=1 Tax=Paramagnetospirillum magneticum (strain ATCC 700264 / AMB-1) TaxID=342108 RepID=Q2W6F4_PARM1|nr:hypothetical protein [Paramagnetospirillum magneticum]BAE50571.1 hypothetical protein amb1767 [Paramagnetospirillum magneticum AMB-1]